MRNYTPTQVFFVEKMLDLYHLNSLDTYRVKVNNPYTCLLELQKLLLGWSNNQIKNTETVISCIEELVDLLNNKECLIEYGCVSKENFIKILNADKEKLKSNEKLDGTVGYYLKEIIKQNKTYLKTLIDEIESILFNDKEYSFSYDDLVSNNDEGEIIVTFKRLSSLLGFLSTELLNHGFSKVFLFQFIKKAFIFNKSHTFNEKFDFFKNIIFSIDQKTYCVFFKIYGKIEDPFSQSEIDTSFVDNTREEVKSFFKEQEKKEVSIKKYTVSSKDFYKAIKEAQVEFSFDMDKLHLKHNKISLLLCQNAVVMELGHPAKAQVQKLSYSIDGDGINVNGGVSSLSLIFDNIKISKEIYTKIKSALRYYRMGNESDSIEQKYICYWIALEHIFSTHQKEDSTFTRLKIYLSKILTIYYIKRNLLYIHLEILKQKELFKNTSIFNPSDPNNIDYFNDSNIIDEIAKNSYNKKKFLLYHKLKNVKSDLHHTDKIKKVVTTHKKNVERHIIRLYRVRNELIHDAAIVSNIENITGNLRYYLLFTLELILNHYSKVDCVADEIVSLDDFFYKQDLLMENVINSYVKENLLNIPFVNS